MILVSLLVFVGILGFVTRKRSQKPAFKAVLGIGLLAVVGGTVFAKLGAGTGWPWWIYYMIPMLVTVLLPPFYFRMNRKETGLYLLLSFTAAPAIHLVFSFFIGWRTYMPFIELPSLWDLP